MYYITFIFKKKGQDPIEIRFLREEKIRLVKGFQQVEQCLASTLIRPNYHLLVIKQNYLPEKIRHKPHLVQ